MENVYQPSRESIEEVQNAGKKSEKFTPNLHQKKKGN
jgi:hypothetical protein